MFHFDFMIGISLSFGKEQERKKIFFNKKVKSQKSSTEI